MKKLLTAIAVFVMATVSYGQGVANVVIKNETSCNILFVLLLDNAAFPCGLVVNSSMISVPAGGTLSYTNTTYPGYVPGTGANFVAVRDLWGITSCGFTTTTVGEPCTGWPLIGGSKWYTSCATLCGTGQVEWDMTGYPTTALVRFF